MAVKLDRLNEYVMIIAVMVIGTVLAIFSGRLSGSGDTTMLVKMVAVAGALIICLTMRTKAWLLIPMFWVMSGQMNSVPGHLPVRDLVVGLVVLFFFTLKAFKIIRSKPRYGWLDLLMIVNLLYLASVYFRNPVGVHAFGSDKVGGRPYLEIIFSLAGYWVMNQVSMTPKQAWRLPFVFVAVPSILAVVNTLTFLVPSLSPILGKFYSGIDAESYIRENRASGTDEGLGRAQFLAGVGSTIVTLLSTYLSPITLINPLYIWRFLLTVVALVFCLKSGHRLTIPGLAATIGLATYFRKGMSSVIIMGLLMIPPIFILVALQGHGIDLPESAQRTLSFLPGNWDPRVVSDAKGSSEWRFEMWKIVMSERKYIQDKTFGDGFGFSKEDLDEMTEKGSQEDFMILGDVHSGPVSAIRAVGYVGLGLFIILLGGIGVRSWILIREAKGTPFFPLSLFLGIPCIYGFFGFIFIYGDFGKDCANMVMAIGFQNLLFNAMVAERRRIERESEHDLPTAPTLNSLNEPGPIPVLMR